MGTNYYATIDGMGEIHIGLSAAGWCFSLHVIPELGINSLTDWRRILADPSVAKIADEYGRPVTWDEMEKVITERGQIGTNRADWRVPDGYGDSWGEFHDKNCSQFGPNGLLRFRISKLARCVGHGEGTWDYIIGEFS